jgi:hypothetical protein
MKNLPRVLRTVAVLAGAFALGMLFNRDVIPFLSRDVKVWVIQGEEGRGCAGLWGATMIRFGQGMGQSDGAYQIPCDKVSFKSDTFALLCKCR